MTCLCSNMVVGQNVLHYSLPKCSSNIFYHLKNVQCIELELAIDVYLKRCVANKNVIVQPFWDS